MKTTPKPESGFEKYLNYMFGMALFGLVVLIIVLLGSALF
jgi:hypothetical protein